MKTITALLILSLAVLLLVLPAQADDGSPPSNRLYLPALNSVDPPTITPVPTEEPVYFKVATVLRCDPNAGVTYANGTVKVDHQPANGYFVAFSYEADGPIVAKIQSGPHEGYPYWNPGYFSHIIGACYMREGDWRFWIVDEDNVRISAIAHLHTDGEYSDYSCQQAILEFDTQYPGGTGNLPPHP